ncbi:MAG: heparan-alpha-glucosaminide N-acetyltransferase domain-containing protein [bacterium]
MPSNPQNAGISIMTIAATQSAEGYTNTTSRRSPMSRVTSLDIVRGVVMVLMAIDHVRVYSGLPPGGPTPGIFFTRWITHFVAPAFLFLAGTSAFLYGHRVGDKRKLATFLLTRGLWLVFLELTVIRIAWTFNLHFAHYMLAGVIWMIGWCMVLMSALVFLPRNVIATLGIAIIVGHNITDFFPAAMSSLGEGSFSWLWKILYLGGEIQLGAKGPPLVVLFVIIPWIGVMATGYGFGPVMLMSPARRRSICLRLGVALIAAFIALRSLGAYGDPRAWRPAPVAQAQPTASQSPPRPQMPASLAFLNTSKYPASLLFLLMTLGPMLVLLGVLDGAQGKAAQFLETFGRVPFFYYLLHIPLIHLLACVVSVVRDGSLNPWLFTNHPMRNPRPPDGYAWSLPLLYLVWSIAIALLYVACRWYARRKAQSSSAIYRYI